MASVPHFLGWPLVSFHSVRIDVALTGNTSFNTPQCLVAVVLAVVHEFADSIPG